MGDFIQIYKSSILRPSQHTESQRYPYRFSRDRKLINKPITQFLLNRMATQWNNLSKKIASASCLNYFKNILKRVDRNTHI